VLDVLLSVETYQRLITERGWKQKEFVQRVWELCAGAFLVEPLPMSSKKKLTTGRKRG